jgi:ribosomal protein L11 methyltransferase
MSNYIQIEFQNISTEQSDMLIAELADYGYEGFEEAGNSLKAFIKENDYDELLLGETAGRYNISFNKIIIAETNWNQVWESNFQPVIVDDFVAIRAEFHEPILSVQHEIVITPKMSFGTGHHATTYMMIQQMREIDFNDKSVFDFGTGTGVLAILAEKLGAKKVIATDNDEWSINNAGENIVRNDCTNIELRLSSEVPSNESFDIILANINKNVILSNLQLLIKQVKKNGILLLSGLLKEDQEDILQAADQADLKFMNILERNNWLGIRLSS